MCVKIYFEQAFPPLTCVLSVCICMCRLLSSEDTEGEASMPSRKVLAHCMSHSPAGRLSGCLICNPSVLSCGSSPVCSSVSVYQALSILFECHTVWKIRLVWIKLERDITLCSYGIISLRIYGGEMSKTSVRIVALQFVSTCTFIIMTYYYYFHSL